LSIPCGNYHLEWFVVRPPILLYFKIPKKDLFSNHTKTPYIIPPKNPNSNPPSLIEIEVKPTYILESFVAYSQHLDIAWPQQILKKGANNLKTSQYTRDVNVDVMVKRLSSCLASPKFIYSFKKSYSYMTKLSLVIQEMNNKNKCTNTSP
jgi:hypothetical protein